MREWLPKLVGIERALGVAIGDDIVPSVPEEAHAAALVRDTVTPAVHYLRFEFSQAQVEAFAGPGEVALVARHPAYEARRFSPTPSAMSCWATCGAQQSRFLSADQGLLVQVFTGGPAVGHTLRSPEFGAGAAGFSPAVPPTRAKLPISDFARKCFP